MTDRELLELAAKALGIEDVKYYLDNGIWNPLTDDGDALRLAVKLKMMVNVRAVSVRVFDADDIVTEEPSGRDLYAATRRAIVRAAAEIGKGMT